MAVRRLLLFLILLLGVAPAMAQSGPGPGGFAPYSYTHLGGRQLALSISSVQSLTPPQGAVYASVQANGGTAFYSLVGVNPGLADGSNELFPGQPALWLSGADIIANFRAIGGAGVSITVEYFK